MSELLIQQYKPINKSKTRKMPAVSQRCSLPPYFMIYFNITQAESLRHNSYSLGSSRCSARETVSAFSRCLFVKYKNNPIDGAQHKKSFLLSNFSWVMVIHNEIFIMERNAQTNWITLVLDAILLLYCFLWLWLRRSNWKYIVRCHVVYYNNTSLFTKRRLEPVTLWVILLELQILTFRHKCI